MHTISGDSIKELCIHFVGNKIKENELLLSNSLVRLDDKENFDLVSQYLLNGFLNNAVYHNFHNINDINLNDIFSIVSDIFANPKSLLKNSKKIAKYLYENSIHPQIKDGELYVAYLDDCFFDNNAVDAIGIFKSETKEDYLKVSQVDSIFKINHDKGIDIKKLDKGCLIFNTNKAEGYKVCVVDTSNKNAEAQYWREKFLNITPCSDSYHHTKDYLTFTKGYVINQLNEDFEITKADQLDYLNRSVDYFKTHEIFDERQFSSEVFGDSNVIKSFNKYKNDFELENEVNLSNDFFISAQALKKQMKTFKSVLKLDKNFHIYIHGNRELIEQGVERDGRKYYKIYFNEEH